MYEVLVKSGVVVHVGMVEWCRNWQSDQGAGCGSWKFIVWFEIKVLEFE